MTGPPYGMSIPEMFVPCVSFRQVERDAGHSVARDAAV